MRRAIQGDVRPIEAIRSTLLKQPRALQTYLIGLLGKMATLPALQSLLDLAGTTSGELRNAVLDAIANSGRQRRDERFLTELAPVLEAYFSQPWVRTLDSDLANAIAVALSHIGAPSGIEILLQFVDAHVTSRDEQDRIKIEQIGSALRQVRNPDAVAVLAARLEHDPGLNQPSTRFAGDALAAMGRVEATQALLNWAARTSGYEAKTQALTWLGQIRDERSLRLLLAARQYRFVDPNMENALIELGRQIDQSAQPQCTAAP